MSDSLQPHGLYSSWGRKESDNVPESWAFEQQQFRGPIPGAPCHQPAFLPLNKRSGGHVGGLLDPQSTGRWRDLDVG